MVIQIYHFQWIFILKLMSYVLYYTLCCIVLLYVLYVIYMFLSDMLYVYKTCEFKETD
jgi:hypothetical protein